MIEQMNVPKLRFGEFEEEWRISKLGDIGKVKMCKRIFSSQTTENGDIPFFKIGTFGKKADAFISHELYNDFKEKYSFPNVGDILMSASGTIGRTVIYSGEPSYFQDSNIVWLDNDGTFTTNDFLAYIYQIVKYQSEGGTIQRLYNSIITSTIYYNPSLLEQQKIASFLTTVDKKIGLLSEKKAKLTEYKKGVMQQLFNGRFEISEQSTQGDKTIFTPPTLRFKADDGSDFPDWEENILGDVIEFFNGKGHEQHIDAQGEYVVVNSKFVASQSLVKKFCNELIFPLNESDITMVMSDVPNGKALAKCYLIPESNRYTLNQRICALRSNGLVINQYLIYQLNRNSFYLKFDTGVGQTNLKKNDVLSCPLSTPNIEEQTKIANFLVATDRKIELANSELEKAKQWKKGLLQQMFV